NKSKYSLFLYPVSCPSIKACIHIVHFCFLCSAMFYISIFYSFVNDRIFAIFIIFIFVCLICIVWRITNYYRNLFTVLSFYSCRIFGRQTKQIVLLSAIGKRIRIIKRINKTKIFKLFIISHLLFESKFHIQISDVIWKYCHFIGMYFILVFVC